MKKIIIFLCLIFSPVTANTYDKEFCPQEPYPVSNKFIQNATKVTGINLLTTKILESDLREELVKEFGGSYEIKITPFSSTDLNEGKFKAAQIDATNIKVEGVNISTLSAKSLCGFSHLYTETEPIKFAQNMLIGFNLAMNGNDFKNSVNSILPKGLAYPQNGVPFLKLSVENVGIEGDKLYLTLNYINFFSNKTNKLNFKLSLAVEEGKIVFTNITLQNSNLNFTPITPLINLFNPFVVKVNIFENKNSVLRVNNVKIVNGRILIEGKVYIPKNI